METAANDALDVAYMARLARLRISEQERVEFQGQLDQVLAYVRQIRELDLSGIEPTSHAHPVANVFRPDTARPGLAIEDVERNAPEWRDGQFVVPPIIE